MTSATPNEIVLSGRLAALEIMMRAFLRGHAVVAGPDNRAQAQYIVTLMEQLVAAAEGANFAAFGDDGPALRAAMIDAIRYNMGEAAKSLTDERPKVEPRTVQ